MNSYADFKKATGFTGQEIQEITGYTRQGLNLAFRKIDEGNDPSKKFLICINEVIKKRIEINSLQYERETERLKTLQNSLFQL